MIKKVVDVGLLSYFSLIIASGPWGGILPALHVSPLIDQSTSQKSENNKMNTIFFSVFPEVQHSACTIPSWPLSGEEGGGTLNFSLQPGGGVWGEMGSKLGLLRAGIEPRPSRL